MGVSLIPIGWQWVRKILVRYMLLEIHPVYKKPDLILLGRRLRYTLITKSTYLKSMSCAYLTANYIPDSFNKLAFIG